MPPSTDLTSSPYQEILTDSRLAFLSGSLDAPLLLDYLVSHRTAVEPGMAIEAVSVLLRKDAVKTAAVVLESHVLVVASIEEIEKLLSTRYGFALYASKGISNALREPPLRLTRGQPVETAPKSLMNRADRTFHEDLLLVDEGGAFIGFIAVHISVRLQHFILECRMSELGTVRDRALEGQRAKFQFLANSDECHPWDGASAPRF